VAWESYRRTLLCRKGEALLAHIGSLVPSATCSRSYKARSEPLTALGHGRDPVDERSDGNSFFLHLNEGHVSSFLLFRMSSSNPTLIEKVRVRSWAEKYQYTEGPCQRLLSRDKNTCKTHYSCPSTNLLQLVPQTFFNWKNHIILPPSTYVIVRFSSLN
jgi:hypothetical protein